MGRKGVMASMPLARSSSMLCRAASSSCGSAGTTSILVIEPSSPRLSAARLKTAGSRKRKISGALASTAGLKVSVCQPLTTTTARVTPGRSPEERMKGSGTSRSRGCGLSTKKSTSSSSCRACAMYLRCWRTRKPFNSKYSRTMVSLTAAMGILNSGFALCNFVQRPANQPGGNAPAPDDAADPPGQYKLDLAMAAFFVELHRLHQFFALRPAQINGNRQAGALKQMPDALQTFPRHARHHG